MSTIIRGASITIDTDGSTPTPSPSGGGTLKYKQITIDLSEVTWTGGSPSDAVYYTTGLTKSSLSLPENAAVWAVTLVNFSHATRHADIQLCMPYSGNTAYLMGNAAVSSGTLTFGVVYLE